MQNKSIVFFVSTKQLTYVTKLILSKIFINLFRYGICTGGCTTVCSRLYYMVRSSSNGTGDIGCYIRLLVSDNYSVFLANCGYK